MAEIEEQQADEREALLSIYDGDTNFKQIDANTFQYKYGEDDHYKSFLVEVQWTSNYPNEIPKINMDTFFNRNLVLDVKTKIKKVIAEEAEQWLGCGMTYTLFECLKDQQDELTSGQPDHAITQSIDLDNLGVNALKISDNTETNKKKEVKKEQLTKAQKRRQWERTDHKGDKPRGWDWVDIVKHLSQTGGKDNGNNVSTSVSNNASVSAEGVLLQPLNI
ncbi:PREDICTED: RWD domain-containing protein 4 [Bactrocera latifrons]|uniref:RWD domain-containing protein 4 n=1 Tax=Bactrocera latifrons TaxID=174628 RepID=A0A0K8U2P2_BACLA|nr:PREDICTED: RWD domain-containing protein 4 [Bactrocera latifrons]